MQNISKNVQNMFDVSKMSSFLNTIFKYIYIYLKNTQNIFDVSNVSYFLNTILKYIYIYTYIHKWPKNRRRKAKLIGHILFSNRLLKHVLYLLTAIGLSPGGRSTVRIYTQTIHRTIQNKTIHRSTQQFWKSAGRAPSWLVIPWHLPYNRGKSTEKPQSG